MANLPAPSTALAFPAEARAERAGAPPLAAGLVSLGLLGGRAGPV